MKYTPDTIPSTEQLEDIKARLQNKESAYDIFTYSEYPLEWISIVETELNTPLEPEQPTE